MQPTPTPYPKCATRLPPLNSPVQALPRSLPQADLKAARIAYREKQAAWAAIALRQDFADESHMLAHLKAARIRIASRAEPATVARLRTLLTRVGVRAAEIVDSVGMTLHGFLELNPRLPLWAAVALVLESTGRFTPGVTQ